MGKAKRILLCLSSALLLAAPAAADTMAKKDSTKTSAYDKLIEQGGSSQEGMFAVRHIKDDWYWEIPDSMIGRLMLMVTRFESTPQGLKLQSGEEVNHSVVYFEQYGQKNIFLKEYVQTQYADDNTCIAEPLRRSTVDPIVHKFEVIGRNGNNGAQLVNVTKLVTADNKLFGFTSSDRQLLSIGSIAADRTMVDTMKTYPINVEVRTIRTYGATPGKVPATKTGSVTMALTTSIVMLPSEPMRPRYQDERVGYFADKITTFNDDGAPDHLAVVSRYKLVPKNVKKYLKGELVEPVNPIVYYIDPATPKKWAKYLKMGIEDWNEAFEAAGFKNAIQARDWPDDPSMSIDDARYSVVRYIPSENENAYGPRIVDPRSGQIMESHIGWYHNVITLLKKWYMTQCGALDKRAQTMDMDDELMGQLVRFVSSHEVGHTLGLRHNMGASFATPIEKLRDKAWVEAHGHTVSIMDYARFNYVAQPEDNISEKGLFPRIGEYDKWAVKWGYQYRPEFSSAEEERTALRAEVTKALAANPRLWFGGEGKNGDPRAMAEDLSDNNIKAAEYGIKNFKRVMQNIEKWTAQPDGVTSDLSTIHTHLRSRYILFTNHVQAHIGASYYNSLPGKERTEYESKARQKEAVAWLGTYLFDPPLWLYPERITSKLGVNAVDEIRNRQNTVLALFLSPGMILRIHNNSLRSDDPYKVDEYLKDVAATVWTSVDTKDEIRNDYRRQLQRNYLGYVNNVLNPSEKNLTGVNVTANRSDVVVYMERHLDDLEKYVAKQMNAVSGGFSKYHYKDLLRQIKKIRKNFDDTDK